MSEPINDDGPAFPELKGTSLPSDRYGAWIVQRVTAGWVHLMSGDMTATLRMPVDRFNWYWSEFRKSSGR